MHEPRAIVTAGTHRRRRWPVVVAGVALAAIGGTAVRFSAGASAGTARVVGGNRPVNAGATDPVDLTAHNSPALRANPTDPRNLAVANRIDGQASSCALHVSFDGGASWTATPLALPEGRTVACFSPDLSFGADGTLYVVFTSFAPVEGAGTMPDAVWLVTSADGGRTLGPAMKIGGPRAFQLRVAADPAHAGRLYLAWLQGGQTSSWGFAGVDNPVVVSRSDDGGETWGSPVRASGPSRARVIAPSIAVGPTGDVAVAYLDVGDDRLDYQGAHEGRGGDPYAGHWALVVARSSGNGTTWREVVVDAAVVPTQRFLVLFPPAPALAVDRRNGALYVAFHSSRMGDPDVWVWASDDGGTKWRAAKRVNDTQPRDGRAQYLPQLAVAPDGRLDVVYYDRRRDSGNVMNTVSMQSSFDGARTFGPHVVLSDGSFDARIGFGSDRDLPDLGDRLGIVATTAGALAVWTDTRAGLRETGKQDLAGAVVAVTPPPRPKEALRVAGAAVAAAGVIVALAGVVWRRRVGAGSADPAPNGSHAVA